MAVIYLFHPKHGIKIATMEMEAQYDEMNGWSRFEPDEMLNEPQENVMVEPRRRGRPRATQDE